MKPRKVSQNRIVALRPAPLRTVEETSFSDGNDFPVNGVPLKEKENIFLGKTLLAILVELLLHRSTPLPEFTYKILGTQDSPNNSPIIFYSVSKCHFTVLNYYQLSSPS